MKPRVLHVLDHSLPLHSGYTFRTVSILREQRRLGWETFQLTGPKHIAAETTEEELDGWLFYRTLPVDDRRGLPGLREWALMRRFERRIVEVCRQVRPHLLHAHSPVLNVLPALRAGRRLGLPVVYEVRAFWEDAAVDHGTTTEGSLRYRLTRAFETRALRKVDHVFTICEGLRTDMVARGIAADKITVIPNAVDIEKFSLGGEPDRRLLQELGLIGCPVIGFVGSFYAYEGLDLLLEALPLVRKVMPEARLLLVGGGPEEEALKNQAHALGIAEQVVFAGRVPHGQVSRYYDLIDVLAYPRHSMRLTELVTPLKPLEAMAQGRVLAASDVGGHKELVRSGETGLLFKAGSVQSLSEALLKLLSHSDLRQLIRAAGRRFVENERNWQRSVDQYRPVYERVSGRHAA